MRPPIGQTLRTQRLALLAGAVAVGYAMLFLRSFELQVVRSEELGARQRSMIAGRELLPALRGDLFDREGVLLATSLWRYQILAETQALSDAERARVATELSAITGEPRGRLLERLAPKGLVRLVYGLHQAQVAAIRQADLPHLRIERIRLRSYPTDEKAPEETAAASPPLAAAFTGFVGVDEDGLSGVEQAFDAPMTGEPYEQVVARDGYGRHLLRTYPAVADRTGHDVQLALDARLQVEAERALERALERTGGKTASLIAIDPRSGDVLASAEAPTFDANQFWSEDARSFRARAWTDEFEPGSTLKPFVAALALDAGVVTIDEQIDCGNGRLRIGRNTIRDLKPHERLPLAEVLAVSSNIGAARLGERLGARRLVEGLRRFGFGQPVRTSFPGVTDGRVRDVSDRLPLDRANLSFGQGMRTSVLQLALAGASLANGGLRVHPRIALRIGSQPTATGLTSDRIVSEHAARTVLGMMEGVVSEGTGKAAALEHYRAAGKTGTAQKYIRPKGEKGWYSRDLLVVSFLGIVPVADPRLVVAIAIDEPQRDKQGGLAAAPVFREFAEAALRALEVPPEVEP